MDLDKLVFQLKQQANGPLMPVLKKLLSRHDLVFLLKELAARQEALATLLRSLASRQDALSLLKRQASWQDALDALVPIPPCPLARNCTARADTPTARPTVTATTCSISMTRTTQSRNSSPPCVPPTPLLHRLPRAILKPTHRDAWPGWRRASLPEQPPPPPQVLLKSGAAHVAGHALGPAGLPLLPGAALLAQHPAADRIFAATAAAAASVTAAAGSIAGTAAAAAASFTAAASFAVA